MTVRLSVADVGKKIGGKVEWNVVHGYFTNACPIRMSYVLNSTGFPIVKVGDQTVSGGDHHQYFFRVNDLMGYLANHFGAADKTVKAPTLTDFAGMKGILVIKGHGWKDAKGHVTLWDGTMCSDTCHLMYDPENGPFVPETASLWVLP